MNVVQYVYQRRAVVLVLIFLLVISAVAEEGVLVLDRHGPEEASLSRRENRRRGRRRFAANLGPERKGAARHSRKGTKPGTPIELQIDNQPSGIDVDFLAPFQGQAFVPPFDNEQVNFVRVVLVRSGDLAALESGSGNLALKAATAKSSAEQQNKAAKPTFEGLPPSSLHRRIQFASSADGFVSREHRSTGLLPTQRVRTTQFSRPLWQRPRKSSACPSRMSSNRSPAGEATTWCGERLMVTASIETRGDDPFSFVRSANQDVQFGAGLWSLRECNLQPVLLQFQQRDRKRFAEIIGTDAEWLSKTLTSSCDNSANAALSRMLDKSGHLSALWSIQVPETWVTNTRFSMFKWSKCRLDVNKARTLAAGLGLQSDRAVAFLAAPAVRSLVSADAKTAVKAICRMLRASPGKMGAHPTSRRKLEILKYKTIESWKGQPGTSPEATSNFVSLVNLLSAGTGTVSGRHYDLDEFGIGLSSAGACRKSQSPQPIPWNSCSLDVFDAAAEMQIVGWMNQERNKARHPAA